MVMINGSGALPRRAIIPTTRSPETVKICIEPGSSGMSPSKALTGITVAKFSFGRRTRRAVIVVAGVESASLCSGNSALRRALASNSHCHART